MSQHFHLQARRSTREAEVLAPLAARGGLLESAVRTMNLGERVIHAEDAATLKALEKVVGEKILEEVTEVTGLSPAAATRIVLEQLDSVAHFVRTDGEPLPEDFKAVEQLIRSGRGQLFVRTPKARVP